MAELFYRKLTGLPGGESPVVMVTTVVGVQGLRTVEVGECLLPVKGSLVGSLGAGVCVWGGFVYKCFEY